MAIARRTNTSWSARSASKCDVTEVGQASLPARAGTEARSTYVQLSLSRYTRNLPAVSAEQRYLPVRRFNPAALITARGRSALDQLMKASAAIVIEDPDLQPEHLIGHVRRLGLDRAAVIHFVGDGFQTKVRHYVITKPEVAEHLPGERLW